MSENFSSLTFVEQRETKDITFSVLVYRKNVAHYKYVTNTGLFSSLFESVQPQISASTPQLSLDCKRLPFTILKVYFLFMLLGWLRDLYVSVHYYTYSMAKSSLLPFF